MAVEKQKKDDFSSPHNNFLPLNLTGAGVEEERPEETEEDNLQGVLQVFRVFKLARILKLARHSRGLQSIIFTLSQSARELGLLVLILIITGLAFSSLAYYIELVSQLRKTARSAEREKIKRFSFPSLINFDVRGRTRDLLTFPLRSTG